MNETNQRIAVLLPCYNEAVTIGNVVREFRREIPTATIYVFDNNSTDNTAAIAREAGAVVVFEPRQGKGYVIEGMFSQIQADYYVMADGDGTYPAERVQELLNARCFGQGRHGRRRPPFQPRRAVLPPVARVRQRARTLAHQHHFFREVDGHSFRLSCLQRQGAQPGADRVERL